jgi:hypothetical protein
MHLKKVIPVLEQAAEVPFCGGAMLRRTIGRPAVPVASRAAFLSQWPDEKPIFPRFGQMEPLFFYFEGAKDGIGHITAFKWTLTQKRVSNKHMVGCLRPSI